MIPSRSHARSDSDKKVHQGWGGDDGPQELAVETAAQADATGDAFAGGDWAGTGAADDAWDAPAPAADTSATPAAPAEGDDAAANGNGNAAAERRAREREEVVHVLGVARGLERGADRACVRESGLYGLRRWGWRWDGVGNGV